MIIKTKVFGDLYKINMKYIIEIINPELVEIDANSEEEAIEKIKSTIQDLRLKNFVEIKVCKETNS